MTRNMRCALVIALVGHRCGRARCGARRRGRLPERRRAARRRLVRTATGAASGTRRIASKGQELTGDWGGTRACWKDKGVVLDSSLTQFYQGVSAAGLDTGSEYNGTAQAKLGGTRFRKQSRGVLVRGAQRGGASGGFGGPLLTGTGTINPVNTAAMIPGSDGSKFLDHGPQRHTRLSHQPEGGQVNALSLAGVTTSIRSTRGFLRWRWDPNGSST